MAYFREEEEDLFLGRIKGLIICMSVKSVCLSLLGLFFRRRGGGGKFYFIPYNKLLDKISHTINNRNSLNWSTSLYLTDEQNCCSVWNCCRLRHVTFDNGREVEAEMSCKSFDDSSLE